MSLQQKLQLRAEGGKRGRMKAGGEHRGSGFIWEVGVKVQGGAM